MTARLLLSLMLAALALAPRAAGQDGDGRVPSRPSAAQAGAWTRYTYPGEEFSVELPGMPWVFNTRRAGKGFPPEELKGRVFGLYSDGVIYMVASYDDPQKSESLDSFAANLRGWWTLVPRGDVNEGGAAGRAYTVTGRTRRSNTPALYGEGRAFIAKRHAYFALAFSNTEGRAEVSRFLDSLRLGDGPAGERIAEEAPVPRYVPPAKPRGPLPGMVPGPGRGGGADGEPGGLAEEGRKPAPTGDGPFMARDVERKAMVVYKPEPPYTEQARRSNVNGTVILRVVLASDGRVTDVEVVKALSHGLTESAIRVARRMLFFPAENGGRAVSQYVVLEYNFNVY